MARSRRRMHFTDRKISKRSVASLCISFVSLLWFVIGINVAVKNGDATGRAIGGFGMLMLVAEIIALVMSMQAFHDDEVLRGLPLASLIVAGILLVAWVGIFCFGIYIGI